MKKNINGKLVEYQEVEPVSIVEPWTILTMPNGDIVKMRPNIAQVWYYKDEKGISFYETATKLSLVVLQPSRDEKL